MHFNVQDRYHEIALEDLPLTIRDAIHVCQQMNIPYLWIDSIYIIQDDKNVDHQGGETDKDRELRKVAGIFSGAVLTVAASCALSADAGFLQDRQPYSPGIALPGCVNDAYDIAQLVMPPEILRNTLVPEPIDVRAWTFQEQLLSCRVLSFTKFAVQWHCRCKDYCISQEEEYSVNQPANYLRNYIERDWNWLLQHYSDRDLSNLADRPVAIAAVAESFVATSPNLTVSDYIAGLWKPRLLEGLFWRTSNVMKGLMPLNDALNSKRENLSRIEGPSWSWTTIPETVGYSWAPKFKPTAEILDINIILSDPDHTFGAVKSGTIRLRGFVSRKTRYMPTHQPNARFRSITCQTIFADRRRTPPMDVFLFELGLEGDVGDYYYDRVGLALQSTGEPGEFVRVGSYREHIVKRCDRSCASCDYNGDREERIIEIV
jgi:hypothetical protein